MWKDESVFSIENQGFAFLNVGGFFTYRRGGERQTRIRPRSDPDGQTQIPQTPKTLGNNEGSGKCFGRETRLRVLECAVAVREPFEKLKVFSQTGLRKLRKSYAKVCLGLRKYVKIIGLRNGSRTRRAAPTVSGLLIKPVDYQEF